MKKIHLILIIIIVSFLIPLEIKSMNIFDASQKNDIDFIKLYIKKGKNINDARYDGNTPLIIAAKNGQADAVKLLLENKADINARDNNGCTALMWAAQNGKLDIVNFLINSRADINAKNNDGSTVLINASYSNQLDTVKLLINSKAELNVKQDEGYTALIEAVLGGHVELVKLLISAGADINVISYSYTTALSIAIEKNNSEIAGLLKNSGAKVLETPKPGKNEYNSGVYFYNKEMYKSIDQYALKVPASSTNSVKALAEYLSKGTANDLEKARAIFVWIKNNIKYDHNELFKILNNIKYDYLDKSHYYSIDPRIVLKSRKTVCAGYANLYCHLADEMGLLALSIVGSPNWINRLDIGHAWNSVQINGGWYLIEPQGGFCIPPEKFIYSYFPADSKWQLLDKPITFEEFIKSYKSYTELSNYSE